MKRKLLAILTSVLLLCTMLPLGAVGVSAETNGTYNGMTYVVVDDKVTITGYTEELPADLVIPATIGGYPVDSIADYAFVSCENLVSLIIPDSVTAIWGYAFQGCVNLREVTLGNGIAVINEGTFYCCNSLTTIHFPETVTSIGDYAFSGCGFTSLSLPSRLETIGQYAISSWSLYEVTIPASVRRIGEGAFGGEWLQEINVDKDNAYYSSVDGVLFNKDQTALLRCPRRGGYVIPDGVRWIASQALPSVDTVVIPTSVVSIEDYAFSNLFFVRYMGTAQEWAENVYVGYDYALSEATWSYADTQASSVGLQYTITDGGVTITGYTEELPADLVIPDTIEGYPVVGIAEGAFEWCETVAFVTIPDSVTTMGYGAFSNCFKLAMVTMGNGLTVLPSASFMGCDYLFSVELGNRVTTIGDHAFAFTSISSITLPASVAHIGYNALGYAPSSLCAIHVQPGNPYYASVDGVLFNSDKTELMQYPCGKRGAYTIPVGVTSIADHAFSHCEGLTAVTIPDGVTTIGVYAFENCSGLTAVTIPPSVTWVKDLAFAECANLKSVYITDLLAWCGIQFGSRYLYDTCNPLSFGGDLYLNGEKISHLVIPDGVTEIGDFAFYGSTITSVTITDRVEKIGLKAFGGCMNLTTVTIPAGVTYIDVAFQDSINLFAIHVDERNETYCSADGVLFTKDMTALDCCPEGKAGAYVIPDGVTTIRGWAFYRCRKLTSVTIPEGVHTIGRESFYYCDALVTLSLPRSLSTIGRQAVACRKPLTDVYYGGSEAEKANINIDSDNDDLLNATWHYNCINPKDQYDATVGHSVMDTERGNGLAFRFELAANGVAMKNGNTVDLTNATINYLGNEVKLIGMGAMLTNVAAVGSGTFTLDAVNGINVLDIPTVYMQEVTDTSCAFATRLINIPDTAMDWMIYARPYYIVEVDGEEIVVYGDVDSATCAEYM